MSLTVHCRSAKTILPTFGIAGGQRRRLHTTSSSSIAPSSFLLDNQNFHHGMSLSPVSHHVNLQLTLNRRPQQPAARSKRRSGRRERVRHHPHLAYSISTNTPNSQGQGQPCRRSRQSHLRQAQQRCPLIPTHHSSCASRSIKDQWISCSCCAERSRGERPDHKDCGTQQRKHLHEGCCRW